MVGVDFSSGVVIVRNNSDKKLLLNIWDMSGKKEDVALTSVFYQGSPKYFIFIV